MMKKKLSINEKRNILIKSMNEIKKWRKIKKN